MPSNLIEQVLKTIRNYDMLKPKETILVAVSGGPDSTFLLHALNRLKRKLDIKRIVVCNLDHGLRGMESKEDSLFVKRCSKELGFYFIHKRISLKKDKSLSTEESARKKRYEFFKEAAKRTSASAIATGHTLDDQAETILMRLIKGSSLKGIVGIAPLREEDGIRFIRPLLELEKQDIEKYLDAQGIDYRVDSTNIEPIYFRNVVRREIIPFLERYNPRVKRVLFNLAGHLREDLEFIKEEKSKSRKGISFKNGYLVLKLKDIVVQPKALQKEILRDALDKIGGEVKRLSFRHWKEMDYLLKFKRKGSSLDLPGRVRVMRTQDALILTRLSFHR